MKNKLFQLAINFNNIDRRYIQFAYFVLMLGVMIVTNSPDDGGSGTR